MSWKRALRIERPLRRQAAEDVEAEISFHLDARTEDLVATGLTPKEARRQAEREFGDVRAAADSLVPRARRKERVRRAGRRVDDIRRDAREAIRSMGRNPAFTLVAVATLAISIGANTGIFSVANAVMFRPLPYADVDRIVAVNEVELGVIDRNPISSATFIDWRNEAESFTRLGAYSFPVAQGTSDADGRPRQVRAMSMTPDAFSVLGVSPVLGRLFADDEGVSGAPRVAVLSWGFWQSRYGGDEGVIGTTIALDGRDSEIVGVMGPRFRFPDGTVEVFTSLRFAATSEGQNRGAHQWYGLGQLAPGATPSGAKAELDAISARLEREYPQQMQGWRSRVMPLQADLTRTVRPLMWVLLAVVVAVLLVACANLANLMLARFAARSREMAVRSALGAGRARLVRRGLVETGVIAAIGGGLGVLVGIGLTRLFVALAPADIPLLEETGIDTTVLAFALAATVASTALFGLVPSLRASRVDPAGALREGRRGSFGGRGQSRLRSGILVSQVALSSLLLIGAGLLVRSLMALQSVDYGYETGNLLVVSINLPQTAYPSLDEHNSFYDPLLERLEAIPGVTAVGSTSEPPVVGYQMTFGYELERNPRPGPDPFYDAVDVRYVTPGYFDALRQSLVAGRLPNGTDRPGGTPVFAINESLARLRWPGEDPIGQRLRLDEDAEWAEIVGVVADTRHRSAEEAQPAIYAPFAQKQWDWLTWQSLMLRTEVDPATLRAPIEEAIWSLDASLPIERFVTVDELYADGRARSRFAMQLLVAFGIVAVLLGAIGLYGVLAYAVGQRRQEIGVRMALGAGRPTIASMVVRDGLRLCLLGVAIGIAAAVAATRLLESLLYGVGARDPLTFAAIPVILLSVGVVASWLPARRAARTDPATVLRDG